jgi:hypothetical protein
MDTRASTEASATSFAVPWRRTALAAVTVATAALAALAIVATVENRDVLSTVALSLAILAFLIQIIVFIAQTWTTSQQMLQAQVLNAQSGSLLTEIRTHTQGTQAMLADQMKTVLDHAFQQAKTVDAKSEDALTLRGVERSVRRAVDEVIRGQIPATFGSSPALSPPSFVSPSTVGEFTQPSSPAATAPDAEDQRILARLKTYPAREDAEPLLEILERLSPLAMAQFRRYAQDEVDSRSIGMLPGLALRHGRAPFSEELMDAGLIQPTDAPIGSDSREWRELSEIGREAARLIFGEGDPPEYLLDRAARRSTD